MGASRAARGPLPAVPHRHMNPVKSNRRRFLQTFTLLSAASCVPGDGWNATVLAQLRPVGGALKIRVGDFPALGQDNGSVRIGPSAVISTPQPGAPACTQPRNRLIYPILINRVPGPVYRALDSRCTHADCTVSTLNTAGTFMQCPGHGSRFRSDGTVLQGPATLPLTSYDTTLNASTGMLLVRMPDIFFEFVAVGVQPAGAARLTLEFLANAFFEYEVHFRIGWDQPATRVNFALTPEGPLSEEFLTGNDDYVRVHVDRVSASGFYSIVMRTREV